MAYLKQNKGGKMESVGDTAYLSAFFTFLIGTVAFLQILFDLNMPLRWSSDVFSSDSFYKYIASSKLKTWRGSHL